MKDPNNPCIFCDIKKSERAHENKLAYASYDSYPVTEHHCLIIPKRHIKDYFDLSNDELVACNELIQIIKKEITKKDILLKEIKNYDEILLLGSGKGVTSVGTIHEIKWKRKNLKKFKILSKHYDDAIKKCNSYKF